LLLDHRPGKRLKIHPRRQPVAVALVVDKSDPAVLINHLNHDPTNE
jgi:hypothetical protein